MKALALPFCSFNLWFPCCPRFLLLIDQLFRGPCLFILPCFLSIKFCDVLQCPLAFLFPYQHVSEWREKCWDKKKGYICFFTELGWRLDHLHVVLTQLWFHRHYNNFSSDHRIDRFTKNKRTPKCWETHCWGDLMFLFISYTVIRNIFLVTEDFNSKQE